MRLMKNGMRKGQLWRRKGGSILRVARGGLKRRPVKNYYIQDVALSADYDSIVGRDGHFRIIFKFFVMDLKTLGERSTLAQKYVSLCF